MPPLPSRVQESGNAREAYQEASVEVSRGSWGLLSVTSRSLVLISQLSSSRDGQSSDSVDMPEAMRERTSTICEEAMGVEPMEPEVVLETKPRSCTL